MADSDAHAFFFPVRFDGQHGQHFQGVGGAAVGGLGGGMIFAGPAALAEALAPNRTAPQDSTTPPAPPTIEGQLPGVPPAPTSSPPRTVRYNGKDYHFDGTAWNRLPSTPEDIALVTPAGTIPMNPAEPAEGNLIARLEILRIARERQEAADRTAAAPQRDPSKQPTSPEPGATVETVDPNAAPPNTAGNTQPPGPSEGQEPGPRSSTAPAGGTAASGQLSPEGQNVSPEKQTITITPPSPSRKQSLPDPTGADIISSMQAQRLRLGGPARGTAEWEWYEQLEREAASSPLRQQSAEAAARRGELDDPKAMLAWLHQQRIVDPTAPPGQIDEVAAELSGEKQSAEDNQDAWQTFDVDATSLGPAILDAIQARLTARSQPDPTAEQEREQIERERQAKRAALIASSQSTAPEMSGNRMAAELADGDTITISGQTYTAADVDADGGSLSLVNKDGTGFGVSPFETFRVDAINGQPVAANDTTTIPDEDNTPFSLASQNTAPANTFPTDPATRVSAVRSALLRATGLRKLPERVRITHSTGPVTMPDGSRRQWQARVNSGRIEINAANITSAEDAVWNLEHELAHEAFRAPTPALKRAWNRLTKSLAKHPDIRQEVEALRYDPDTMTEEMAVRLAQKLDAKGPWSAAWEALKEAVFNFLTGQWGSLSTTFTDRIAAALAARAIMADARARLKPDPSNPSELSAWLATPEAAALSLRPSDLLPDGTPRPEVIAEIEAEKADIERRAIASGQLRQNADGTWTAYAPNGQPSKLNEGQWVAVRTRRFKEWFGDWESDPANASKVVDENGEPLVVYHASPKKFTAFDSAKKGEQTGNEAAKKGFFFGQDREALADIYGTKSDGTPADGQMVDAFLNLPNPKEYHVESLVQFDRRYGADSYAGDAIGTMGDPDIGTFPFVWAATTPTQIKSATANLGTYSAETGDIRYSFAPEPPSSSTVDNLPEPFQNAADESQNQDHQRSKGAVQNLLESAARLARGGRTFCFGPEQQADLPGARESQLKELAQEARAQDRQDEPTFTGGEHRVWIDPPPAPVIKHTKPGFYGRAIDEAALLDDRTFQNRPQLILRGALPSEYLRRWAVLADIFGLPTDYQGTVGSNAAEPQMAIAQPYVHQNEKDQAQDADVIQFMENAGFFKVDPASIAIPEIKDVTWYRQRDGILITDAHARNFRKASPSGVIVPVDLVVATVPRGVSKILPEPLAEWQPQQPATGRAQPLDAPVLTTDGYRPIGSLAIGDTLASTDGQSSTVTGIYPQGRKQVFKITLADGRTVRATADHLWLSKLHWHPFGVVRNTQTLKRLLTQGHKVEIPALPN